MNRFLLKTGLTGLIVSIIFYSIQISSVFAAGVTGTYSGAYSGSSPSGNYDSGTITITIDAYGNVVCDFHSTIHGTDNAVAGSVNVDPTVSPPLNKSTIACMDGPIISFGPAPSPPFFAAITDFIWDGASGNIAAMGVGSWFNSNGYGGSFSLNLPASPNAATTPINTAVLSGLWYDPNYTGSGFNLVGSTSGLIVTYYGWDKSGNRLWLTSDPWGNPPWANPITLGQSITLDLSQTADGAFTTPAPPSTGTPWGTLTLTFTSCTAATATLRGVDGNITESLNLLVGLNLNGVGCQ